MYHYHQVALAAWISLTLSVHPSLSSITLSKSSKLHSVFAQSLYIYIYIYIEREGKEH